MTPMSRQELLALPTVVDLQTACRALGIGRTAGYELARTGMFPCSLLKCGRTYRVPTARLLDVLGEDRSQPPSIAEPADLDERRQATTAANGGWRLA